MFLKLVDIIFVVFMIKKVPIKIELIQKIGVGF